MVLVAGKVITVESVPDKVNDALTVRVLASVPAKVRVEFAVKGLPIP